MTALGIMWNLLTNALLLSYRRTGAVVLINLLVGVLRTTAVVVLPLSTAQRLFLVFGLSQVANVVLSVLILRWRDKLKCWSSPDLQFLRRNLRYASSVYLGTALNLLPDSILPLIVLDCIGVQAAGYFYIAFASASALYAAAFSVCQNLFSETARDGALLEELMRKAWQWLAVLMIGGAVAGVCIAPVVFGIVGHGYSRGVLGSFDVLVASGFLVSAYVLLLTLFKALGQLRRLVITAAVNALTIIVLAVFAAQTTRSLVILALAWFVGNGISVIVGLAFFGRGWRRAVGLARRTAPV